VSHTDPSDDVCLCVCLCVCVCMYVCVYVCLCVCIVHELLEDETCLTPTPQMMADLQSLSSALLESLNDKNVALSHQRKTNRSVYQ